MPSSSSSSPYRLTLVIITVFLICGVYQGYRYVQRAKKDLVTPQLTKIGRLQTDFEGTLSSGEAKKVSDLAGKVLVFFPYRTSGDQAVDLVAELKPLMAQFAQEPRVCWIGLTVDPETDTAERRQAWAQSQGLSSPQVWLMNGRQEEVRTYLTKQLGLRPIRERAAPEVAPRKDALFWDSWAILVDHQAHIRRRLDLAMADPDIRQFTQRELGDNIKTLLSEINTAPAKPLR
jgi:cytochrome oxidase Cu insertion factor (SCO1/SenC/PrrC family)